MITIKEVAKEAGVSVGTVSNVINGKTKNMELIEKVEAAINLLGFIPDSKAKHLKSSKSNLIGLVFENRLDAQSRNSISEISSFFQSKGYDILVNTTEGNQVIEEKLIHHYLKLGVDGILVNTTSNHKKWYKKYNKQVPIVFMYNTIFVEKEMDVVKFSCQSALEDFENWCEKNDKKKTGYILIESQKELVDDTPFIDKQLVKLVGESSNEWGFKQAFDLLAEQDSIDSLVIGNYSMLTGVNRALELLNKADIALICIKNKNWLEDVNVFAGVIHIPMAKITQKSCELLLNKIEKTNEHARIYHHEASFHQVDNKLLKVERKEISQKVKIGVLNSKIMDPLIKISGIYKDVSGVELEFRLLKYKELARILSSAQELKKSDLDVVMYDVLWKNKELMNNLKVLDEQPSSPYFDTFIDQSVENYGMFDGKLHGLPLLGGTQLLIYQKDLFEDGSVKRLFELTHGYELSIPKNWSEFEVVAKFFTKEFNSKSPVSYGTSMTTGQNVYSSIEFMNRLFSYMSLDRFKSNKDILNDSLESAFKKYTSAFNFTNKSISVNSWEEMAEEFKKGDTAMAIIYDSFIYDVNDSVQSYVAGNISSTQLPGNKSILGGWGIGVSRYSDYQEDAENFIKWLCSSDVSKPLATLTGSSIHKDFYNNKDLDLIYPWKKDVLKSYKNSINRENLHDFDTPIDSVNYYEEGVAKALSDLKSDKLSEKEAIELIKNIMLKKTI